MNDQDRNEGSVAGTQEPHWSVWRQDDNGNVFLVRESLTETEALRLVRDFERRGHNQTYWAQENSWDAVIYRKITNFCASSDVLEEMEGIRRYMDRLFSPFMGQAPLAAGSGVLPALNVMEEGENIVIHVELPGVKPEDIEISVEGDTLTLSGDRELDVSEEEKVSYHRQERAAGRFRKAITLPVQINAEGVQWRSNSGLHRSPAAPQQNTECTQLQLTGFIEKEPCCL